MIDTAYRIKHSVLVLVLVCACALSCSMAFPGFAQAESAAGSIVVDTSVERDGQTVCLDGDEYSIVRVADASLSAGPPDHPFSIVYATLPEFKDFDLEWDGMLASEMHEAALRLNEYVTDKSLFEKKAVSAGGTVSFKGLTSGAYLLTRTSVAPANSEYAYAPVLISVPCEEDGEAVYDVHVSSKFEWDEPVLPEPEPDPSPEPGPKNERVLRTLTPLPLTSLLQTGDETGIALLIAAMVIAVAAIAVFVSIRFKRQQRLRAEGDSHAKASDNMVEHDAGEPK